MPRPDPNRLVYRVKLDSPEGAFEGDLEIPRGPIRLADLAYCVLGISGAAAESVARGAAKLKFEVSCRKGCGACCRQLVPISPAEALMIGELVDHLPEPRRSEVRDRYASAEARLKEAGLWERLNAMDDPDLGDADHEQISKAYFALGIACPFLVEESCGIYNFRPTVCREYLVVSPAENCADPFTRPVNRLPLSVRMSDALARVSAEALKRPPQLIPLSLALAWTEANKGLRDLGWDSARLVTSLMGHLERAMRSANRPGKRSGG